MKNPMQRDEGVKLAPIGSPRSNMIRARVRRSRPRPEGMTKGKDCPKHPMAESRLAMRLKDYETIKNKTGYNIPGSLQFR